MKRIILIVIVVFLVQGIPAGAQPSEVMAQRGRYRDTDTGGEGYARKINDKTYYFNSQGRQVGESQQVGDQQVMYGPSGQKRGSARVGEDGRVRFYGNQGGQSNVVMQERDVMGQTAIGEGLDPAQESQARASQPSELAQDAEDARWFAPGSSYQGFYVAPEPDKADKKQ